jgi:hypothetical protein
MSAAGFPTAHRARCPISGCAKARTGPEPVVGRGRKVGVEPSEREWIKSSSSNHHNAGLELARSGDEVLMRDSKDPDEQLHLGLDAVRALIEAVKNGEFDHLTQR